MDIKERALLHFTSGLETRRRMESTDVQQMAVLELLSLDWAFNDSASTTTTAEQQETKARQLLRWFKHDYFTWVNQPPCAQCGCAETKFASTRAPQTAKERAGLASVVEMYTCPACPSGTAFPRFNHPCALFESRRGRCGEFANAFCALAIACGFQTRYVLDLTDHVWAELFVGDRWVHCDPCENAYDTPLMYESGWNKKLSFCFAYEGGGSGGGGGARDVTRRYSRQWGGAGEVVLRRLQAVSPALVRAVRAAEAKCPPQCESEQQEFRQRIAECSTAPRELKSGEEVGRISGSAAWKQARGEDGGKVKVKGGKKDKPPAETTSKQAFQARFQELRQQGLAPNEAAVQALREKLEKKE